MKSGSLYLSFSLALIFLSSCEKVIDIDLRNAETKYVIEAVVTDQLKGAKVKITRTKDFEEDNNFPGVTGAQVSIREDGRRATPFTETVDGTYENQEYRALPGRRYQLSVKIGETVFTAICNMPEKVDLDSIFVTDEFLFTDTRKIANAVYRDPAGRGNAYRFIQYVNDDREEQLFIQNDEYTDGRTVTAKLFFFADDDEQEAQIKSGDQLKIEFLCIDPVIYKYWFSLLRSSTGDSGQATPSNPITNWNNGALGYFSVHSVQSKTILVP